MKSNAISLLNRELAKSIDRYLVGKKQNIHSNFIKNIHAEKRFHNKKVWENSD